MLNVVVSSLGNTLIAMHFMHLQCLLLKQHCKVDRATRSVVVFQCQSQRLGYLFDRQHVPKMYSARDSLRLTTVSQGRLLKQRIAIKWDARTRTVRKMGM